MVLLSTTLPYSDFYEVIYNKDKKEFYLGTYKKVQNCCIENFNHIPPSAVCQLGDKMKKKMSKKKVQNNNNTPLKNDRPRKDCYDCLGCSHLVAISVDSTHNASIECDIDNEDIFGLQ